VTGPAAQESAPLPPEVQAAIAAALAALDASPDGWLEMPARRRLRAAFGPWTPWREPGWPDTGILRRAALLIACVERVLPVWEAAYPGDHRPREAVELTRAVLWDGAPEKPLDELSDSLHATFDTLGVVREGQDPSAFWAVAAAWLLDAAAFDGELDPEFHPLDRSERELDEPPVEACVARALAGYDPQRLREYWRWYVTDAFPTAYRAAP
jgi:hypothetical protein